MITLATVAAACMFCAGFCGGYATSQFVELLRMFRSVRPLPRPQQRISSKSLMELLMADSKALEELLMTDSFAGESPVKPQFPPHRTIPGDTP